MAAATAVSARSFGRKQFQALFSGVVAATATLNPGSLTTGTGESDTVALSEVQLGDIVLVSFKEDMQGLQSVGYVSAAGVVTIRIDNNTGGTIDLASITINVLVLRPDPNLFF